MILYEKNGDWGLGIGDLGLGFGANSNFMTPLRPSPTPNTPTFGCLFQKSPINT